MNREIEFRAWDGKKMLHNIIPMRNYAIIKVQGLPNTTSQCLYVEVEKIMQCTGLYDKNGTKIFEGDIVKFIDYDRRSEDEFCNIGAVSFFGLGWDISNRNDVEMESIDFENDIEVIGNIYENKELIK